MECLHGSSASRDVDPIILCLHLIIESGKCYRYLSAAPVEPVHVPKVGICGDARNARHHRAGIGESHRLDFQNIRKS